MRPASALVARTIAGMKLKLDLHDIYNHGGDIDHALQAIIDEAVTPADACRSSLGFDVAPATAAADPAMTRFSLDDRSGRG